MMSERKIIKLVVVCAVTASFILSSGAGIGVSYAAEKTAYVVLGTLFDKYERTQEADA